MECNKDEAMRAKEIAVMKFGTKDFEGAKKFALKAQNLYPGLEGVHQMLATFDVYISASKKTNGEADWYSILGINPSADDETVKKQYRKLALVLHPDKNKSIGAEGAFQLITEAWAMLSDKSKRASYDQRTNSNVFSPKPPRPSKEKSAPASANGSSKSRKSNASSGRVNKKPSSANKSSKPRTSQNGKARTFWTQCRNCKMGFQYPRTYYNRQLVCQNCQKPFLAIEATTPDAYGSKKSDVKYAGKNGTVNADGTAAGFRWTPFVEGKASNGAPSFAQKTYENAVREFEAAVAAERQSKGSKRKREATQEMATGTGSSVNLAKKRKGAEPLNGVKGLSQAEVFKILMDKGRRVIQQNIGKGKSKWQAK